MSRNERGVYGFTLIELMIVVSIIGILASIAIPKFADLVRKSKEGATKGSLGALRSAVNIYYSDMEGFQPCSFAALTVNGKYLTAIPTLQLPSYHTNSSFASTGISDVAIACSFVTSDTVSSDTGLNEGSGFISWAITSGVACLSAGPGAYADCDPGNIGKVWVPCSHTDSKGTAWFSY